MNIHDLYSQAGHVQSQGSWKKKAQRRGGLPIQSAVVRRLSQHLDGSTCTNNACGARSWLTSDSQRHTLYLKKTIEAWLRSSPIRKSALTAETATLIFVLLFFSGMRQTSSDVNINWFCIGSIFADCMCGTFEYESGALDCRIEPGRLELSSRCVAMPLSTSQHKRLINMDL